MLELIHKPDASFSSVQFSRLQIHQINQVFFVLKGTRTRYYNQYCQFKVNYEFSFPMHEHFEEPDLVYDIHICGIQSRKLQCYKQLWRQIEQTMREDRELSHFFSPSLSLLFVILFSNCQSSPKRSLKKSSIHIWVWRMHGWTRAARYRYEHIHTSFFPFIHSPLSPMDSARLIELASCVQEKKTEVQSNVMQGQHVCLYFYQPKLQQAATIDYGHKAQRSKSVQASSMSQHTYAPALKRE